MTQRAIELQAQGEENLREMNLLQIQRTLMWHRFHDFWDAQSEDWQTSDFGMELRQKYEGEDFDMERVINTKIQRKKLIDDELRAIGRLLSQILTAIEAE
jgi:hypothetical protein